MFPLLILLFILSLPIPLARGYVTPVTLQASYESKAGNRAANLDSNIRLLTVLSLQQNGWTLRGTYFYRLFELDLMWVEAENFCRSMGAHLVSIKDEMENQFVHALRKKSNIWIGLNKIGDPQQVYKWSDNSSADFLNWDSTQPNEPKVDCVYMAYSQEQRGTWFDYGCREMLPQYFMCKLASP